jgi:hypothetical protein
LRLDGIVAIDRTIKAAKEEREEIFRQCIAAEQLQNDILSREEPHRSLLIETYEHFITRNKDPFNILVTDKEDPEEDTDQKIRKVTRRMMTWSLSIPFDHFIFYYGIEADAFVL